MNNKTFAVYLTVIILILAFAVVFVSFIFQLIFSGNNFYRSAVQLAWEELRDDEEFAETYGTPKDYSYYYYGADFNHSISDHTMSYTFKVVLDDDVVYLVSVLWEYPKNEKETSVFTVESVVPFKG